jgi:D-psicose/D-tagatose/L-ribulose 3-epimerase
MMSTRRFGVSLFLWTAAFTKQSSGLLSKVAELGFDLVEIPLDLLSEIDVERTKKELADCELQCTCCAVMGPERDLINEDSSIRKNAKEYLQSCIKMCSQWNSKIFCGPLYTASGKLPGRARTEQEWDMCVKSLREIGEVAADYGVVLAIEPLNRFETYFLNTTEDAVKLIENVDHTHVKLLLDTFHMNVEEKDFYKAFKLAGEDLVHVHANENDRGTPGSGHVDWPGIFKALDEIGYDRALVMEAFVPGIKQIAKAACIWREIFPNKEEFAKEGLAFLKEN